MNGPSQGAASREQVFEVVRAELARLRRPEFAHVEISPGSSLLGDLGFDSLSMIEVAATLEDALGIGELSLARWREQESEKIGARFTVGSLTELCLRASPPRVLALQPHRYPGVLVTFCGIDGSGKTTMMQAAAGYLRDRGLPCHSTFTPTPLIRKNALFRELVDASTAEARARVDVMGLGLQILGDLLQHLKDTIVPRLERGEVVLCDRYLYTTQAEVRSRTLDPEVEQLVANVADRVLRPDLAVAMDVAPAIAEQRVKQRDAERHKPVDPAFIAVQAETYLSVAKTNGLFVVSSDRSFDEAFNSLRTRLDGCLAERGR